MAFPGLFGQRLASYIIGERIYLDSGSQNKICFAIYTKNKSWFTLPDLKRMNIGRAFYDVFFEIASYVALFLYILTALKHTKNT